MIQPLNKQVIVKPAPFKQETESGLILTTNTAEKPSEGIIVAKADDSLSKANVGDTVLYSKYAGYLVLDNNQELLFLDDNDLLGIRK